MRRDRWRQIASTGESPMSPCFRWLAAPLTIFTLSAEACADAGPGCLFPFVGGGLWCMRYRVGQIPKKKVLAAVLVGFVLLSLLPMLDFADATPPRRPELPRVLKLGEVEVNVTIVEEGNAVELIVPSDLAD